MSIKHSGCSVCKSKEQEILKSFTIGGNSQAICDSCKKKVKVVV